MLRWLLPCVVACVANGGPEITSIVLEPTRPTVAGPVACRGEGADPDGDALAWSWSWTVDGVAAGDAAVLAGPLPLNAMLVCTATARDGRGSSATREVRGWVAAGDTEVLSARIVPDPVLAEDAVSVDVEVVDATGPPELAVRWWLNGVLASQGPDTALPSTVDFTRGDLLEVQVEGAGGVRPPVRASAVVGNTAPRVDVPVMAPIPVRGSDAVTATVAVSDADGDAVELRWWWTRTRDGVVEVSPESSNAALPLPIRRGDRLFVTVEAFDAGGTTRSTSAEVAVANAPPMIRRVLVGDGSGMATGTLPLRCSVEGGAPDGTLDVDGDPVTLQFSWSNHGVALPAGVATASDHPGDTLPVGVHQVGDSWTCSVVASDGVDVGLPVTATTSVNCRLPLLASHPEDGDRDVSVRPVLTLAFGAPVAGDFGLSLRVRATGALLPLAQDPTWSDDGRHVWLVPAQPLSTRSSYSLEVSTGCGVTEIDFATGTSGGPLVVPEDLTHRSWALNIGRGVTVVQPRGTDPSLGAFLGRLDVRVLLTSSEWDATNEVLGVTLGGHDGIGQQELCLPTVSLPAAVGVALPYVVVDAPGRTEVVSPMDRIVLHDLHLQGTFTTRGQAISSAHLRTIVDLETILAHVGPQLGVLTVEEACLAIRVRSLGGACEPCPDHGRDTCLRLLFDDLVLEELEVPGFEPRSEAAVAADPRCTGSRAALCGCAVADPRSGIGALLLLALAMRRRQAGRPVRSGCRFLLAPMVAACGQNAGPEITSLELRPARPSVEGPVRCVGEGADPDGDTLAWTWAWRIDGEPAGDTEVLAGPFAERAVIVCRAEARDGRGGSATREVEGAVTTGNTEVVAARIIPDPVRADDVVSVEVDAVDPDGAPELTVSWWVNAVLVAQGAGTVLPSSVGLTRGDLLEVQVEGNGSLRPPAEDSGTVVNTPPRVEGLVIHPGVVRGTDAVTASATFVDADGDLVAKRWTWERVRGLEREQSASSADSALPLQVRRGDRLRVTVAASDVESTATVSSAEVTVANVAPVVGGVTLRDAGGGTSAFRPLRCEAHGGAPEGSFDFDADDVSLVFAWENEGVLLPPGIATTTVYPGDTLPIGVHRAGDQWTCSVVASDGVDTSPPTAGTATVTCQPPLMVSHPAANAVDVTLRPVVALDFAEDVADVITLRIVSRGGGSVQRLAREPVWSSDGRHVWITTEGPLLPQHPYEVRMESDCGVDVVRFVTSTSSGPILGPEDLEGKTWAIDLAQGFNVIEPRGAEALLRASLSQADVRLVLVGAAWDPAASSLALVVGSHDGTDEQDVCFPTVQLPDADVRSVPYLVLDAPGRFELVSSTDRLVVHDLHLQGSLTTRARGVTAAHLRAVVDMESVVARVGPVLGVQTAGEACAMLAVLNPFETCEPCPGHGRATCARVFLDDLTLVDLALPDFVQRSDFEVASDPECSGTQAGLCACGSTGLRAFPGTLAVLALGLRRRRR